MHILEIPIIGSKESSKEKLYTLLSDVPLRNFQGLDFGALHLSDDLEIFFYFLDQENENYHYLWDLIIPHAYCCLILIEWDNEELFSATIKVIEHLERNFQTPIHVCAFKPDQIVNDQFIDHNFKFNGTREFLFFDINHKESAKKVLNSIFDIKE